MQAASIEIVLKLTPTILPWSGAPVTTTGDIGSYLRGCFAPKVRDYLPGSITVYADREIEPRTIDEFVAGTIDYLRHELSVRKQRRDRFVELGFFDENEIDSFLTDRCDRQPWVLYYSGSGGLRTPVLNPDETSEEFGVVPCATMQNHGVAWRRGDTNNALDLWLVTARKEGCDWDWDSDIGHESAHAAFAQIPLYVQPNDRTVPLYDLSAVSEVSQLTKCHLARMSYMYMETAVIAMRGEERHTESGLPLAEKVDELHAFLRLSQVLMPALGFDRALAAYERVNGILDYDNGPEVFEIGAPAMRVVPHVTTRIHSIQVPEVDWFRSLSPSHYVSKSRMPVTWPDSSLAKTSPGHEHSN
ncbi:MAG TPA: hypothetical protein VNG71_10995 [Pyrinomonadaceae bacterium]|nr:hypothetical protein [Pyrinomonadaceae bacterium]